MKIKYIFNFQNIIRFSFICAAIHMMIHQPPNILQAYFTDSSEFFWVFFLFIYSIIGFTAHSFLIFCSDSIRTKYVIYIIWCRSAGDAGLLPIISLYIFAAGHFFTSGIFSFFVLLSICVAFALEIKKSLILACWLRYSLEKICQLDGHQYSQRF